MLVYGQLNAPRLAILIDLISRKLDFDLQAALAAIRFPAQARAILSSNASHFGGNDETPFTIPTTIVFESDS